MTEERNDLLPDDDDAAPKMTYDDIKYPLLERGIPIPQAMEDYINGLIARDTLSTEEVELIRQEMLSMFEKSEQPVPADFDANFEKWFPR